MILSRRYKVQRSSFLLIFLLLITLTSGLLSELFQNVNQPLSDIELFQNPLSSDYLAKVEQISVKNGLGEFVVKKTDSRHWELNQPRNLPAKLETIKKILQNLRQLKIKKLYKKDLVNTSHFALENPLLTLELKAPETEPLTFKLGLVNAIDNSAYISLSNKEMIYQTQRLLHPIETFGLADFIDSNPFSLLVSQVSALKITRTSGQTVMDLRLKDDTWMDRNGREMETQKVKDYLTNLLQIQAHMILDKRTEELDEEIKRWLTRPLYKMTLTSADGEDYNYQVTHIISRTKHLKVNKGEFILISASDRSHPYVVRKSHLRAFNISLRSLRQLSIKKLFY
jgi:hypothetical protein